MEKARKIEMTSTTLHIMAMVFMLLDHLWGTVVPGNDWMTCIGRLTFPIYAFMLSQKNLNVNMAYGSKRRHLKIYLMQKQMYILRILPNGTLLQEQA